MACSGVIASASSSTSTPMAFTTNSRMAIPASRSNTPADMAIKIPCATSRKAPATSDTSRTSRLGMGTLKLKSSTPSNCLAITAWSI